MGETEASDKKFKKRLFSLSFWTTFFMGIILGVLLLGAARFITFKSDAVHYHANFALYVNGQQDEFKNPTFYEEVQICGLDNANDVKERAHIHDEDSHLIHIHANGVTWSQFFANLGYVLGNTVLKTDNGVYIDGQDGNHLTFVLNGSPEQDIANRIIGDRDTLLINYGKDNNDILTQRFNAIPRDAAKADTTQDPNACSGSTRLTFKQRLKHAIGIGDSGH